MATTIFFNGRLISAAGSYSEVDATGLEVVGLGASGIVACLGTAIGGKPYSEVGGSDVKASLQVATNPQQPLEYFRSGDLREAGPILFAPADDPDIQGGAQEVVFVKVNQSAASAATFDNADGNALTVASRDYGFFTTQIKVAIAAGTARGKLLTVTFEDVIEAFDDVGGDALFTVQYEADTPAEGFTTAEATISASELSVAFTRDQAGLDADVTNQVTAGQVVELVSDNAGDTAVVVEVYGTDATDATQREQVTLTGTTPVDTTGTWNSFHGARIVSGTALGTITLQNDGGGTVITTLTAGVPTKGLEELIDMASANSLSFVADGASTARVTMVGLSAAGSVQTEVVQLNGTTAVAGVASWSRLDYLAVGELAAGVTITVSGKAVSCPFAGIDTIQKAADKFNATAGFTFVVNTGNTGLALSELDQVSAVDVKSPATGSFTADLYAIVTKLNTESSLVTAARATPGTGAPDNTNADVFLAGGNEGSSTPGQEGVPTATFADWQAALDLLKRVRVNSVGLLTGDPAVHAAAKAHCVYMGGIGRSERDTAVGVMNSGQTDLATKAEVKAQIVDLNSKHVRAWAQRIERFNTSGDRQTFDPPFGALILLGAQSGSPVGTPLTKKYVNSLSLEQDSSWNPVDDAEEMIQAGLVFGRVVDGIGRQIERNVTTHLTSNNLAFTEASVNEAVNFATFNFRTTMEAAVGRRGFAGTVAAAEADARNILGLLVGVALVTWRSLTVTLLLDVLEVGVEIAPVLPINFVKNTIHLVAVPQSAAA